MPAAHPLRKFSRVFTVWLLLAVCPLARAEDNPTDQRNWLFGRYLEVHMYLLGFADVTPAVRDKLQEGLHRFAFEYWLLSKTNAATASPRWRCQLRTILHREGKNDRYFSDPAGLMQHFVDGELVPSLAIAPLRGLELPGLRETNYLALVRGFQGTFFDATNIFPVDPVPSPSSIATGNAAEDLQVEKWVGGKRWLMLSPSDLPLEPFEAFNLLSITGQAYYLPAFLIVCESDSDRVGALPNRLMAKLSADTQQSAELRAKFDDAQKKCIVRFFEDWFGPDSKMESSLDMLRKEFHIR